MLSSANHSLAFCFRHLQEYSDLRLQQLELEEEQRSAEKQLHHTEAMLNKLTKTNVFNATFHIWCVRVFLSMWINVKSICFLATETLLEFTGTNQKLSFLSPFVVKPTSRSFE